MKYLISLLLLCTLTVVSQNHRKESLSYKISSGFERVEGSKDFFTYNNTIITVKRDKKNLYIQRFNSETTKKLSHKKYILSDLLPKNWVFEGLEQLDEAIYFLYSSYEGKKTKRERLYALKIDATEGTLVNGFNEMVIATNEKVTNNGFSGEWVFGFNGYNKFQISKPSNLILSKYRKYPVKKKNSLNYDVFGFTVFNNNLEVLWQKELKMPYTEAEMEIMDSTLDNDGNLYLLLNRFEEGFSSKNKSANYHLELLKYYNNGTESQKTRIEVPGKFIDEIGLFTNEKGEVVSAGYYSNGGKKSGINGVVLFKFNTDGSLESQNSHEIPIEILNQYAKNKDKRKNNKKSKKGDDDYFALDLDKLYFHKDGAITLLGEQYFVKTRSTPKRTYYTYYYQDVLATKINGDGSLAWMTKVPKRQISTGGKADVSFNHFFNEGKQYILFLDNVKNKGLSPEQVPAIHNAGAGGYLVVTTIDDETGEFSKKFLFNTRKLKNNIPVKDFNPFNMLQVDKSIFIEFNKSKKQDVFVKVEL